MKIIPFFEIDGTRYEIRPTRWLYCKYEELRQNADISNEDKINSALLQRKVDDVARLAERVKELEQKYFESFDEKDELVYKKALDLYNQRYEELTKFEIETGGSSNQTRATIDWLEKLAILGLKESNNISTNEKAQEIWERFVDEVGKTAATEWLLNFFECIFNRTAEEGEIPFLDQMRKKSSKKN